jgi:hypothetical protein
MLVLDAEGSLKNGHWNGGEGAVDKWHPSMLGLSSGGPTLLPDPPSLVRRRKYLLHSAALSDYFFHL